ncbi:hypothetical protein QTL86_22710 [Cellulosilyticum sp. ST5]|uniref:imm11 family protein n=1 Tax=unclassified Cellulosilyticum TaxID=2643091 RepID=UPI000F8E0C67|nr:DUF1629 domain-containing protein [Cellulosilyticum sp. WCF-2]QEH70627.1 maleate cis-trans isomerase [Cellulosilyticum sp. WCF-2]
MKYYELIYDYEHDKGWVGCKSAKSSNVNQYIVCKGEKVAQWPEEVMFEYNSKEENIFTDYLHNAKGWLIVSKQFRILIRTLIEEEVQYLPVKIKDVVTQEVVTDYQVANIIDVLEALDLEHSDYSYITAKDIKLLSVKKYGLKAEVIKGHHIFKLKESIMPIFVSEVFKKEIETNKLSGFSFLEVKVN